MNVQQAKAIATQWVLENGRLLLGYQGAFFHGSINWLQNLLPGSDIDVMVVLDNPEFPTKIGKFIYQNVLLEVSYLSIEQLQ